MIFFVLFFNIVRDWYKIETTHAVFYYYPETETFAVKCAEVFEREIYPKVTGILEAEPEGKTHIVIADIDDVGNGFAIEIFNQVFIWTADIYYFPLRGRHPWLEDVLVHEFTHIVALRKSRKMPKLIPSFGVYSGFFFPFSNLERKITVGGNIAFGFVPNSEPSYFTEGIAQLVTEELGYDSLDSYRNMILRTMIYRGKILPLHEVANFENTTGFEGELRYNHGFSFLKFIKERYGWDTIRKVISASSEEYFSMSFEKLFERFTGKKIKELEREWHEWMMERYKEEIERFEKNPKVGEIVKLEPKRRFWVEFPIIYVSQSYFYGISFFVLQDREIKLYPGEKGVEKEGEKEKVRNFGSAQSFSIYKNKIVASSIDTTGKFLGAYGIDEAYGKIWIYDIEKGKRKEVEGTQRGSYPTIYENKLAFVRTNLSERDIILCDLVEDERKYITKNCENITNFKPGSGMQATFPSFSTDGEKIVFSLWDGKQQDIAIFDIKEKKSFKITDDIYEDRDPSFIEDKILFSSDRDGVFNAYIADIKERKVFKITEEISGVLFPSSDGKRIMYSAFEPDGFKLKIKEIKEKEEVGEINIKEIKLAEKEKKYDNREKEKNGENREEKKDEHKNEGEKNEGEEIKGEEIKGEETEGEYTYKKPKRTYLSLSNPIFTPSVGISAIPVLFLQKEISFLQDIVTLSLSGGTFDRMGRFELIGNAFFGLKGSYEISIASQYYGIPFGNIGTQLSYSNVKTIFYLKDASINYNFTYLSFQPFFYIPIRKNITFIPYIIGRFYKRDISALQFEGGLGAGKIEDTSQGGILGFIFSRKIFFLNPNINASIRIFASEEILGEIKRVSSYALEGFLSFPFQLPLSPRESMAITPYISVGFIPIDVFFLDEFYGFYPGYFQIFSGEIYYEYGLFLMAEVWKGRVKISDTFFFHGIYLGFLFQTFNYISYENNRKIDMKGYELIGKSFTDYILCSDSGPFCSGSVGFIFDFNIFYQYPFYFQFFASRGFQDPLKAPIRFYLFIGISL